MTGESQMKVKFIAAALLTCWLSCFGQGQIEFNNRITFATPSPIIAPIYLDFVGGTPCDGTDTTLRAALLGGASTLTPAYIPGSRTNGPIGGAPVEGTLADTHSYENQSNLDTRFPGLHGYGIFPGDD
jgi:hypothetical protein